MTKTSYSLPSKAGTFLDVDNLRKRVLKPVAEEVGVSWATLATYVRLPTAALERA